MPMNDKSFQAAGATQVPDRTKRPYVKPEFRHEAVFEVMALSCGKISATSSSCRSVRKNS